MSLLCTTNGHSPSETAPEEGPWVVSERSHPVGYNSRNTMNQIRYVGFDADDTLWHTETVFRETQEKFRTLLVSYHSQDWIDEKLYETQKENLRHFGYGVKGFTLSMIETAIELTEGRIRGREIQKIVDLAKEMLTKPVELLEQVEETVERLSKTHRLMIITKGDLFDQEAKITRSGLAQYFRRIEIVTEKDASAYTRILSSQEIDPQHFLMVGNSLRSDILPVLEIGGRAVHIPYPTSWKHEAVEDRVISAADFIRLPHIGCLAGLFAD